MSDPQGSYELRELSPRALAYANDRIGRIWSDQDGVHARAKALRATSVAAYLREPFEECFHGNFDFSNPSGNRNVHVTRALVAQWIRSEPPGASRLCVTEEQYARGRDGDWEEWGYVYYDDVPLHVSTSDALRASPDSLALGSGAHFDQGFLCEVSEDFAVTNPFGEGQIAEIVDGIVGLALYCWDREGVMLAGVDGRWDPRDWA